MAKKNIGATLSIKDNNFTAGIRNAITGVKNLKNHTTNAMGGLKKMQSQSKFTGEGLASLAKKAARVVAAYAGFNQVKAFMGIFAHASCKSDKKRYVQQNQIDLLHAFLILVFRFNIPCGNQASVTVCYRCVAMRRIARQCYGNSVGGQRVIAY